MWARVATFENADIERLRERAGQRPPAELTPDGIRGVISFVDPQGKRQLFITLFDSREQIDAAEPLFERMGDEIPEDVRGRRVSRDYYEVAAGIVALTGDLR